MAKKEAVRCPLGESCPYTQGGKVPNHYTTSNTYREHKALAERSAASGKSASEVVNDYLTSKEDINKSNISDAKIRGDGTLSFAGIGKGKNWKEATKEINTAMQAEMSQRIKDIYVDPEKLSEFIDFAITNYHYSALNQYLIRLQKKNGQVFRTEKQWEEEGYKVDPLSRSASVRRPIFKKIDKLDKNGNPVLDKDGQPIQEDKHVGYQFYGVYSDKDLDESVKEPPKHPLVQRFEELQQSNDMEVSQALKDDIHSIANHLDIDISYDAKNEHETLRGGAGGFATIGKDGKYKIVINTGSSDSAQMNTLAHELGHIVLGHVSEDSERNYHEHRGMIEAEAQMFSYALLKNYGIDNSDRTSNYLKAYIDEDEEKLKSSLNTASKGIGRVGAILEKIVSGTNQKEELDAINKNLAEKYDKKKKTYKKYKK